MPVLSPYRQVAQERVRSLVEKVYDKKKIEWDHLMQTAPEDLESPYTKESHIKMLYTQEILTTLELLTVAEHGPVDVVFACHLEETIRGDIMLLCTVTAALQLCCHMKTVSRDALEKFVDILYE
jgi:hypothetical protein